MTTTEAPSCTKVSYPSRVWAERAARTHRVDDAPCGRCLSGRARIHAYHCTEAGKPGHWHIGHTRPWRKGADDGR